MRFRQVSANASGVSWVFARRVFSTMGPMLLYSESVIKNSPPTTDTLKLSIKQPFVGANVTQRHKVISCSEQGWPAATVSHHIQAYTTALTRDFSLASVTGCDGARGGFIFKGHRMFSANSTFTFGKTWVSDDGISKCLNNQNTSRTTCWDINTQRKPADKQSENHPRQEKMRKLFISKICKYKHGTKIWKI